ncbi:MAG: hypothetical protein AB7G93_05910 [Bdellovibrionales bacterium]
MLRPLVFATALISIVPAGAQSQTSSTSKSRLSKSTKPEKSMKPTRPTKSTKTPKSAGLPDAPQPDLPPVRPPPPEPRVPLEPIPLQSIPGGIRRGEEIRPRFLLNLRGGFLITSADDEVNKKWEHDIWYSYLASVGSYYTFPRSRRQVYFLAGADVAYFVNEEELTSSVSGSYITSRYMQLLATVGVGYEPRVFGGNLGFLYLLSIEAWGEKKSELEAGGFTHDLKGDKTGIPAAHGLSVYYEVWRGLKPYVGYENRAGDVALLGVFYAF